MNPEKRPPWRPPMYDEKTQEKLCQIAYETLAAGGTLAHVAAALDVSKRTVGYWMESYPDFLLAIERGLAKSEVIWVEKQNEVRHPGIYCFSMKNIFEWKDKIETAHTGANGEPIKIDHTHAFTDLTPAQGAAAIREYLISHDDTPSS